MDVNTIIKSLNDATRPGPQVHGPVTSDLMVKARQLGETYRLKAPTAPSIHLTRLYARQGWFNSPYALQSSIITKRRHTLARAARIGNNLWGK